MQFLKPSELPLDTVIEIVEDGEFTDRFIKVDLSGDTTGRRYHWQPLYCEDCCATTSYSDASADEKIKAYRIVSLPYKLAADLVEAHNPRSGVPVDVAIAFMLKEYHAEEA